MMDDIASALLAGGSMETGANRAILRHAVMTAIFCPYTSVVLDVRRAVLIDGSDYQRADGSGRGRMNIMTADAYEIVLERAGGLEKLQEGLGYKVDILDGRELFK